MSWSSEEMSFMAHAIEVAERGRGRVRPNPLVGCVLVKDGKVIAEGWHDHLGGLHAEQMAIHDAEENGFSPNGSTAYVTLEPCNHHGRTPPCTESLMWAGIREVVIAHRDPNPTVRGNGINVLEKEGIVVREGLLQDEAAFQMQPFLHWCENMRPLVTLKVAMDRDGNVDDLASESHRFTSEASLDAVHHLRKEVDAIIIGVGTVQRDDPALTIRRVESDTQPLRVVLDRTLRIPQDSRLLNDEHETLVLHSHGDESEWSQRMAPDDDDFISPEAVLKMLGDRGFQEVLLEGGPTTAQHFLSAGLVDRVLLISTDSQFKQGVPFGISNEDLRANDMEVVNEFDWDGDKVCCWSKKDLGWPTSSWPTPF